MIVSFRICGETSASSWEASNGRFRIERQEGRTLRFLLIPSRGAITSEA